MILALTLVAAILLILWSIDSEAAAAERKQKSRGTLLVLRLQ